MTGIKILTTAVQSLFSPAKRQPASPIKPALKATFQFHDFLSAWPIVRNAMMQYHFSSEKEKVQLLTLIKQYNPQINNTPIRDNDDNAIVSILTKVIEHEKIIFANFSNALTDLVPHIDHKKLTSLTQENADITDKNNLDGILAGINPFINIDEKIEKALEITLIRMQAEISSLYCLELIRRRIEEITKTYKSDLASKAHDYSCPMRHLNLRNSLNNRLFERALAKLDSIIYSMENSPALSI